MLASGDEVGRTQGGRADGYTLEPDADGVDWAGADDDLVAWVAAAVALRAAHPALRRDRRPGASVDRITLRGLEVARVRGETATYWADGRRAPLDERIAGFLRVGACAARNLPIP